MHKFRLYLVLLNVAFTVGFMLALWDLYESIVAAGDTPLRLHHGFVGLFLVAVAWTLMLLYKRRQIRLL